MKLKDLTDKCKPGKCSHKKCSCGHCRNYHIYDGPCAKVKENLSTCKCRKFRGGDVITAYRITSEHWVAGIEVDDNGIIRKTAPILKAWRGSSIDEFWKHCAITGSGIELLEAQDDKG